VRDAGHRSGRAAPAAVAGDGLREQPDQGTAPRRRHGRRQGRQIQHHITVSLRQVSNIPVLPKIEEHFFQTKLAHTTSINPIRPSVAVRKQKHLF